MKGGAGGRKLCEEGAMDNPTVQRIFGLHVWPDLSEDIPLLPIEIRWRELWAKHEAATRQPHLEQRRA